MSIQACIDHKTMRIVPLGHFEVTFIPQAPLFFWHHRARLHHSKINVYYSPKKSNLFLFKMWMNLPNLDEKVHEYD